MNKKTIITILLALVAKIMGSVLVIRWQPFASASLKCMSQSVGTFSPLSTRIYHSHYIRECNFVF